jgi:hypothetical protein
VPPTLVLPETTDDETTPSDTPSEQPGTA